MKKLLLFLLFSLFYFFIYAQDKANNIYKFSSHIEAQFQADTTPWKYQIFATNYSISAYYLKALKTWDLMPKRNPKLTKEDTLYFQNFKPFAAKDYIIESAKKEQIVIINEAHHNARHRNFTASLLPDLYAQGFRYLALEALFDSTINEHKTVNFDTGFYTAEPEFALLIRKALDLGFTLVKYEASEGKNGKEREIEQAQNIYKILQENPQAKILIHCGFAHVYENDYPTWEKAMAGRLKEISGINPLTIDQEYFSEKGTITFNHPFINLLKTKESAVLINKEGQVFNGMPNKVQTDIIVFHPPTSYKKNLPNWQTENRKKYTIPKQMLSEELLLIFAYKKGENPENAIPIAIVEYEKKMNNNRLFLPIGEYDIFIKNTLYNNLYKYSICIK